jgi:hypothetical protein
MALRRTLLALLGVAAAAGFGAALLVPLGSAPPEAAAQPLDPTDVRQLAGLDRGDEAFVRADPPKPAAAEDPAFQAKVRPFLEKYCVSCHKGEKAKAGLALDGYVTEAAARKDRKNWAAIQHTIATGEMPPPASKKAPQPSKRSGSSSARGSTRR